MKLLILGLFACFTTYIGYSFSKKYRQRSQFFQAMVMLCQKFDVEINYSRERVKNIFLSLDEKHKKKLFNIDKNYISFLEQESELNKENLFSGLSFLKEDEKDILFVFFKGLGRSDLDSQSKEVKNFQSRFDSLAQNTSAENKKYGSLSIKLGLIAGLFLIVLFI